MNWFPKKPKYKSVCPKVSKRVKMCTQKNAHKNLKICYKCEKGQKSLLKCQKYTKNAKANFKNLQEVTKSVKKCEKGGI
jgi:hypothetical protein